jgi:ribosomal protein S18 acetylase RimI-like enzyme
VSAADIAIRPYAEADYATVCALWREARMNPFTEAMIARVHAMGGAVFVAERGCEGRGAEVVGAALWVHNGRQAFVWRLAVSETCRRSGIARRLMEVLEESAHAAGFESMGLIVGKDNTGAHALYESLGWTRSETLETWWKYPKQE